MKYPFFEYLSTFVIKNKINVNYKDETGQNAFMYLINNRKSIIKISEKVYKDAFDFFLYYNEFELGITNNGITPFGLCLTKEFIADALSIYVLQKYFKYRN